MEQNGKVRATGEVHIRVVNERGEVTHEKTVKNLVVTAGLTLLANRLTDSSPDSECLVKYIAVGTGTNAPAAGNTTLQTETARAAVLSRTNSAAVAAISTTFAAGAIPTSTIKELGLFIDGSATANSGTLLARVADDFAVTALDSVFVDWRITLADA
jgi:hypothetical protein